MSNQDKFKTLCGRRPALQGAVTRQVNALRQILVSVNPEDLDTCNKQLDKVLASKRNYDEVYDQIVELGFLLSVDVTTIERASDALSTEVLGVLDEVKAWRLSMADLRDSAAEDNARDQSALIDHPAAPDQGTVQDSQWKERFEHLEHSHQETTRQLKDVIGALREEMALMRSDLSRATRAASTPDRETSRRVTFGEQALNLTRCVRAEVIGCGAHSPEAAFGTTTREGPPPAHAASHTRAYPLTTVPEHSVPLLGRCSSESAAGEPAFRDQANRDHQPLDLSGKPSAGPAAYYPLGTLGAGADVSFQAQLLNQSELHHRSMIANLTASNAKLEKFSGDPLEYAAFINAFDELYDEALDSSRAKLTALLSHCEGKALRAIRWCSHKQSELGYAEARRTLRQKFGSPFAVSQSWLSKLLSYSMLRTPEDLENFSCDLRCCKESLETLGFAGELECTNTLRLIVAKLPLHLRNRWRKVHREAVNEGRGSLLTKLLRLVQDAADDLNDPAFSERAIEKVKNSYGTQSQLPRSQVNSGQMYKRQTTYNIVGEDLMDADLDVGFDEQGTTVLATESARVTCSSCCSTTHFTAKCQRYKEKSPEEKLKLVRDAGLCQLCLSNGHRLAGCTLPWRCQEKGCSERHHTSLHAALARPDVPRSSVNSLQVTSSLSQVVTAEECHVISSAPYLPVTAVRVSHGDREVEAFALLDNASTITLSTRRLAEALNLPSMGKRCVNIKTVSSDTTSEGDCVRFGIRALDSDKTLSVKQSMTLETLPISLEHMARAEKLKQWDHLKELPITYVNSAKIDILIGQDNARLLKPESTVDGADEDDPYAVLTPLGWTVYGVPTDNSHTELAAVHTCLTSEFLPEVGDWGPSIWDQPAGSECVGDDTMGPMSPEFDRYEKCDFTAEVPMPPRPCLASDVTEAPDENFMAESLEELLERFWRLDEFAGASKHTKEAQAVLDRWEKEWRLVEGHIMLPIPYRDENPNFPDNYYAALKSLEALGRYLKKRPTELSQYRTAMEKNFTNNYAEICKKGDRGRKGFTWHLMHHGVDHDRKPGVKRIVKNGAGKYLGVSLNSKTFQGPDLMTRLATVLHRFRQFRKGTTGDVEGMFNQVWVPEEERDSQRFLYWEDGDPDKEVIVCRMRTHIFGTVWAPAAAMFALKKTIELSAKEIPEKILRQIDENFYVDDWHNSEDTDTDAIESRAGVTAAVAKGGFNLTKFLSSSRTVLESIPVEKRAKEVACLDLTKDRLPAGCTLGLGWDPEDDSFFFRHKPEPRPETKRGLMSCVAGLYDPLGLIAPFTVVAKMMLQSACRAGVGWDDVLPKVIIDQWCTWLGDLETLAKMRIPRWIGASPDSRNDLHSFGDASQQAYGAATLIVVKTATGEVTDCNLLGSKTKLAPLKTQSIPRLELCAATMCIKLDSSVKESLSINLEASYFWTDSSLVMFYLLGDPANYRPFVANRVSFCQENSRKQQWGHVPGKSNPADMASRGVRAESLVNSDLWLHGPEFLRQPTECWPRLPALKDHMQDETELRKSRAVFTVMAEIADRVPSGPEQNDTWKTGDVAADQQCYLSQATLEQVQTVAAELRLDTHEEEKDSGLYKLVATASSWRVAKRRLAWLRRFACWYQRKKGKGAAEERKGPLRAEDYVEAEFRLLALAQRWHLSQDTMKARSLVSLSPFWDGQVWRVGGRLQRSELGPAEKHPVLVPGKSAIAHLIVRDAHMKTLHSGVDRTLMQISGEWWVCGARKLARALVRSCVTCTRIRGQPASQIMGQLPKSRVAFNTPPFYYTGVDLFGPLLVAVKRSTEKRYGVMFSCFNTRAVHLEVAEDLSASAFICTLERFTIRRGNPHALHSDNGTNFVKTKRLTEEVRKILESDETTRALAERHIKWSMNSPAASHQGGAWERMIRTARNLLMAALEGETVTPDKLNTTMCKVEGVINGRPITKLYDTPESLRPLCPNDVLTLLPPSPLFPVVFSGERYKRDYRQAQHLLGKFWEAWIKIYIPYLQRKQKWTSAQRDFAVGELVIVVMDQFPRFQWPVAVVHETYAGPDGHVRNVKLRTANGFLKRPVQKLVRLEGDTEDLRDDG